MAQKDKKPQEHEKEGASSELLRRFKANPALFIGTVVVLVLVIVSFVLVPAIVPESAGVAGDFTFGYYDKAPISWVPGNYFSQSYEQIVRYYRDSIDINDTQIAYYVWQQAFERASVHAAVLQILKRSNYTVPEKTVDRQVAQLPQFQINGRFSSALYQQTPESSRLTLWRQVQDEIAKALYFDDLFGLSVPSAEADFVAGMGSKMKSFDMVSFLVDDFPSLEYLAYAEENADLFRTIHLSRISVNSSEREAKKILQSIKDETLTFEDVARAQLLDAYAERGGDMGIHYAFELETEIPDAETREKILSVEKGGLSPIFKIDDKWVIFRVEEELKPANFNDYAAMDRVRYYMRNYQRGRMEDWAISQAKDFIADAKAESFNEAVRRRGKEKSSFGPLPVNYGSVELFPSLEQFSVALLSGQDLLDLSRNIDFWKTAFSTPLNEMSEPLVQGNRVHVLLTTEQIDAEEDKTKETADMYKSYWLNYTIEQEIQPFFVNSPKMDNRFRDTYFRIFSPAGY